MSPDSLTVACVKWGPWCAPHGAAYVNRLASGVRRRLSVPHEFVCFTDDPTGIGAGVRIEPLPENLAGSWWRSIYPKRDLRHFRRVLALPYLLERHRDRRPLIAEDKAKSWMPIDLVGWWNKIYLFKRGVLDGRVIFFDLDTVLVGEIDFLAHFDDEFAILRDFNRPDAFGSGVMVWNGSASNDVWDEFVRAGCPNLRRGDQVWIQKMRPNAALLQDRFPGKFVSYKNDSREGPPPGASVVCFHGDPRPHEVDAPWMRQHWLESA